MDLALRVAATWVGGTNMAREALRAGWPALATAIDELYHDSRTSLAAPAPYDVEPLPEHIGPALVAEWVAPDGVDPRELFVEGLDRLEKADLMEAAHRNQDSVQAGEERITAVQAADHAAHLRQTAIGHLLAALVVTGMSPELPRLDMPADDAREAP